MKQPEINPRKKYTLGQIFRGGLLVRMDGKPIKQKPNIANRLRKAGEEPDGRTLNGPGYQVLGSVLIRLNKKQFKNY